MRWINCGKRFPEDWQYVIIRHKPTKTIITEQNAEAQSDYFEMENGVDYDYVDCEWLDEYDESPSSDPEVQQLRQWKKEATALLDPILEYGLKHPDIKLGQSATSFVLNRAKAAEVLVKALEEMRKHMPTGSWFAKTIDKALSQHTQLKQQ